MQLQELEEQDHIRRQFCARSSLLYNDADRNIRYESNKNILFMLWRGMLGGASNTNNRRQASHPNRRLNSVEETILTKVNMVAINHIKESAVRSLVVIGCRGKKKSSLDPNASRLLTALVNALASETLLRAALNAQRDGRPLVITADFQRILPGILLDFST